jgi:hypothetical protein
MKSKTTAIWFMLVVVLAAAVWLVEKKLQPAAPPAGTLIFAGLRAADVTSLQISPAGQHGITVVRTNKTWLLQSPLAYPAQAAAVETLLAAFEKLTPVQLLSAAEMKGHKNVDAEFGFDNPQFTIDVFAGEDSWHLRVGGLTAPGDGVYTRIVGGTGVVVAGTDWLSLLPHEAANWRDSALVDAVGNVDWIVITNGANIELRRDATNHLWRMVRPLQTRADSARIAAALQSLRSAAAIKFVTDDAKADLTTYGLQPAALDVWLGRGTNLLTAVHAGKDSTENAAQMFARREGWNSVVTTAKEPFAAWRGAVNSFRDPRLLEFTTPIAEIEVAGENNFLLQQRSNDWAVVGEKFPAELDSVKEFVHVLANLRVAEFVKDVVTAPDLQGFGFTTNARAITLRSVPGDPNSTIVRILFGATETNRVFVKRSDEDFVYALTLDDVNRLPENGWEFRRHRFWNFSEADVASVTLHQGGKLRLLTHHGTNSWSLDAGQGIINPLAVEETVHRLGQLGAEAWVGRNFPTPEKFGFETNNLQLTVELKSGEKNTVDFGGLVPNSTTAFAATTLDGERWTFVFPPLLAPLIAAHLTIPTDAP